MSVKHVYSSRTTTTPERLYTKTYTGCERYDARNYDLCLDVGGYGVNGAVDFLLGFIGHH